jgi:hypothetical protein
MKAYTAEELDRIFMGIAPGSILLPMEPSSDSGLQPGARFMVFRKYSEMGFQQIDLEQAYWDALREAQLIDGIGELCFINASLSEARTFDPKVHREIAAKFVVPQLIPRIFDEKLEFGAFPVVFSRIGCLQIVRQLMLFGGLQEPSSQWNQFYVGRLALLANDFLQIEPVFPASGPTNLDLLLILAQTWDIYNTRNLGHAMSRMFTLLTEIMPGDDPLVVKLFSRLGLSADKIQIDGIPLNEFVSIVFALFAFGRSIDGSVRVLFRISEIFSQTDFPQELLIKMVDARARNVQQFRMLLGGCEEQTREKFADELKRKSFLTESLTCFRNFPMLRMDSDQVLILDLQFVVELLTSGVYWSIHDNLPDSKRGDFKELWGRMFELYIVGLLQQFYPQASGMLSPDVEYTGGQIDALLDFGSAVIVMEIKSSLLTEPAKRSADKDAFVADFRRKFVENEKGKPKTIKQLAAACRALLKGEVKTANGNAIPVIYPVFVSDEPIVEATFSNAYFNEEFQKEGIDELRVKPLTVMSTDEFEQVLPHVADNDFTWEELLQIRFNEFGVYPFSVGQTIYDLLRSKGLASKQNPALKQKADEVSEIIRRAFRKPQEN